MTTQRITFNLNHNDFKKEKQPDYKGKIDVKDHNITLEKGKCYDLAAWASEKKIYFTISETSQEYAEKYRTKQADYEAKKAIKDKEKEAGVVVNHDITNYNQDDPPPVMEDTNSTDVPF